MPKKIKKPHNCNNHWQPIAQIFQGYELHPLALTEEGKFEAKYGLLLQCACGRIAVVPYKPQEVKPEEVKEDVIAKETNEPGNQEGQKE